MKVAVHSDPTLEAMDKAIEQEQDTKPRNYLGLSSWADDCARKLWYRFRWVSPEVFAADTLRKFADGHRTEDVRADDLRKVPSLELHTHGPDGKQFGVTTWAGHVRGHMDGAILGIVQAPNTWHVWEHKTCDEKVVKDLERCIEKHGEKDALQNWNTTYFGQAQGYMGLTGMKRHYMTVDSAGGRRTVSVRTDYQPKIYDALHRRAGQIVSSPVPLEKLSDDPSFYKCKWCNFGDICHGDALPKVSCRTCIHATPLTDGYDEAAWFCEKHNRDMLDTYTQEKACRDHRFIPPLVHAEVDAADEKGAWIRYKSGEQTFMNADYELSSKAIEQAGTLDMLLAEMKEVLLGEVPF